ncbi:MAG: ATPase, partial [Sphingomonas hengshuiensis]
FQRTRGVLKMMAQVVFRLWRDGSDTPMIMPGYVPLSDDKVRVNVLEPLEPQYAAVIDREVSGDLSRPAAIEARSPNLSSKRAATRAATALFMATAPHGARNPGVEMARLRLGCAIPGDQPSLFGDAIRRMQESSAFLYAEGDRYWFSTQVTLNQEADNRGQALSEDTIEAEITAMLRAEAEVRVMGGWHRVYADADNTIEDAHETALVLLRPAALHMTRSEGETAAMGEAADILERRSAGQRQFRNRLVFLAPDLTAITDLRTNVRRKLAWQSISNDAAGSLQLTPVQASDAANKLVEARTAADRALRNCWKHLLWPVTPDSNDSADAARGFTITGVTLANRANTPLPQAAWDKAKPDGVVAERLGVAILVADLQKVWPAGENHLSIRRLRDWY